MAGEITGRRRKRLGDLLVAAGIITEEQLSKALEEQKVRKTKLGTTLVDLGFTTEKEIVEALQSQLNIDIVKLSGVRISEDVLKLTDESVLKKYLLIPFEYSPNNPNILRVAMADPLDFRAMDDLSIITNLQIEPVIATSQEIAAAIDRYYGNVEAMKVAKQYTMERQEQYALREQEAVLNNEEVNQAPIVRLVTQIIEQAVHRRASDIHIEPMSDQLRIRFRVDGILQETMRHDLELLPALVARIKIISGMDISEKRKPQDGRMTSVVDRQEYDIRTSVLPTVYGEKVVLRLNRKKALMKDKSELGLEPDELLMFNRMLTHPHGIILVTGPTGSGKSTTLYTAISELNREGVNIVTVEDPVEANLNGINQVQVNPKADLTFASALRSILRQDPDIIMIGEIRDQETAEIAVKASITGHLVVSTLHTNNAANTIVRLEDMGVESYLLAESIVGIIAQRLVRKLCPHCKKKRLALLEEKELLGVEPEKELWIYDKGSEECVHCGSTGYLGRIGVFEILPVTPGVREAIRLKKNGDEITQTALQDGMRTLYISGAQKVLSGLTSIEELKRVVYEDEFGR